jgi:SNF2 family DNA or RNA helicase
MAQSHVRSLLIDIWLALCLQETSLTSYDEVRNSYPRLHKPDDMTLEEVQRAAEKEFKENAGPLHQIRFRRIILDEGHQIRNPSSQTSIAVRALHAHYKWILSGTPLLK